MSETDEIVRAFNVQYEDNWLEIEDFRTIRAEDEEEAQAIFEAEHAEEGRHEVTSVEKSYELNKTKIQNLLGGLEN